MNVCKVKYKREILALKKKDYEEIFKKFLGIKKVLWLNKGIVGDDTHGHIDDVARFVTRKKKIFII